MDDEKDDILVDLSDAAPDVGLYESDSILDVEGIEEPIEVVDISVSDEIKTLFENELNQDRSEQNLVLANPRVLNKEGNTIHNGLALVPTKRTTTEDTSQTALVPTLRPVISTEKYVMLYVAGTRYAVPLSHILEVGELINFTPVPNVPDWVAGVTNLRGDIISVVNFRLLLGIEPEDHMEARDLLVAQTLEGDITVCLLVERVIGIANIPTDEIQPIDSVTGDKLTPYMRGVYMQANELLSILNLEGILRSLDLSYVQN